MLSIHVMKLSLIVPKPTAKSYTGSIRYVKGRGIVIPRPASSRHLSALGTSLIWVASHIPWSFVSLVDLPGLPPPTDFVMDRNLLAVTSYHKLRFPPSFLMKELPDEADPPHMPPLGEEDELDLVRP